MSRDIIHRKLKYLDTLASEDAIGIISDKWIELLSDIQLEISFEIVFRTLLDLYLIINLQFDWQPFDWPPLPDDFPPPDITDPPQQGGRKCYYDVGHYDMDTYDPLNISYNDLERFVWSQRYRIAEKETLAYKKMSESMKQLLTARETGIVQAGVAQTFLPSVRDILAMAESRLLHGMYVGFAIVGLSKVPRAHQEPWAFRTYVEARNPSAFSTAWKEEHLTESVLSWENIVGWSRVGYARVGSYTQIINRQVSDGMVERLNEFWLRSGLVEAGMLSPYGGLGYTTYGTPTYGGYVAERLKTLYQRTFMLQRVDQYHFKGGAEQLKQQYNIKKIRPILDRYGVISAFRSAYTSFAHEIYYLHYDSHKLYKLWRRLITEEDIIQKYVRIGCQEEVLREIKAIVKP